MRGVFGNRMEPKGMRAGCFVLSRWTEKRKEKREKGRER